MCKSMKTTALVVLAAALMGCNGRTSLLPNSDPQLRKDSTEFAADAAARHPYKSDAPRGGDAPAVASVDYNLARCIDFMNHSDQDWKDVEVWVNQKYVVFIPLVPKRNADSPLFEHLDFAMIFDGAGNHFPLMHGTVEKVEIYRDGKMYDVPVKLQD